MHAHNATGGAIPGHSTTITGNFDVCKVFGLPCELSMGVGVINTYDNASHAKGDTEEALKRCFEAVEQAEGAIDPIGLFVDPQGEWAKFAEDPSKAIPDPTVLAAGRFSATFCT